jgi:hypothetical protein
MSFSANVIYGIYHSYPTESLTIQFKLLYYITLRTILWSSDFLMGITFVYLFYCQGVTLEKRSLSKKEKNNNGTSGKCSDTIMVEQLLTGAGDEEVVATFSDKE